MSKIVHDMFADIAPRYDRANDVLSFGIHRLWRKIALEAAGIRAGQTVVDICCGTGDVAFCAAQLVGKKGKVIGIDFVLPMLELARRKQSEGDYSQVTFTQGDALSLPVENNYADICSISFGIRNVDDPIACLKEMLRVIKPEGRVVILEFGQPTIPGFSHLYRLYCKFLMPRIGGMLTGNRQAYEYLPNTSQAFPAASSFITLMNQAGFPEASYKPLLGGIAYIYTAKKLASLGADRPKLSAANSLKA